MAARILLVRHGETDWNAEGRIQGHLPVPLNGRGLMQAAALARRLSERDIGAVYSSDLLRALQTARPVAAACGRTVVPDRRLREWDLGVLAGQRVPEAAQRYPSACRIYRQRIVDTPIPGGESIRQRYDRVIPALGEIAARHRGSTVVVVSHGGPLGDCYRRSIGADLADRMRIDSLNAALNSLSIDGAHWTLESWADVEHLAEIGSLGKS